MKGIVKWFNAEKGYGFIHAETGTDVFVHYTSIMKEGYRTLEKGDHVEFELRQDERGLQADQVYVN